MVGATVDHYAALVPPNDYNPIDTRGDVLVMNGRYEEALEAYFKDRKLHPEWNMGSTGKIAPTYLLAGKDSLAEASARSVNRWSNNANARAWTAGMLGDIEIAQGRLDAALSCRHIETLALSVPPPSARLS
jgi:tetratricopeptide (TPR) repeat protein